MSLLVGWAIGVALPVPSIVRALVLGLLAGAVLLNVLNEELSGSQTESRVGAFVCRAVAYTLLLLGGIGGSALPHASKVTAPYPGRRGRWSASARMFDPIGGGISRSPTQSRIPMPRTWVSVTCR